MKKQIVLVAGLPGSGKSYFASRMAADLGAAYLNSDQLRKELDRMGRYRFEDKLAVYTELAKRCREALAKTSCVVVDATFIQASMRALFRQLAAAEGARLHFILVWAEESLIHDRLATPRSDSEADYQVYVGLREQFKAPDFQYLRLQSTNDNLAAMLAQAKTYLQEAHESR